MPTLTKAFRTASTDRASLHLSETLMQSRYFFLSLSLTLSLPPSLSLSFSLSRAHETHAHTHFLSFSRQRSLSTNLVTHGCGERCSVKDRGLAARLRVDQRLTGVSCRRGPPASSTRVPHRRDTPHRATLPYSCAPAHPPLSVTNSVHPARHDPSYFSLSLSFSFLALSLSSSLAQQNLCARLGKIPLFLLKTRA